LLILLLFIFQSDIMTRKDEYDKKWVEDNPNYQSNYYQSHKEKKLKQASDSQKKNLKKVEARNRENHHKMRMKAFELLGSKCSNPFNIDHTSFEQNEFYIYCLK